MRILLISANCETFPEPVLPIGLVYIGNTLRKSGAEVRIFDVRTSPSAPALRKELNAFNPDRIGISLRNVDNASYPATRRYLPSYASLVQSIRASCDAPIILGGSAFSLFPEEIQAYLGADAGVQGEGENAIQVFRDPGQDKTGACSCMGLEDVAFPEDIHRLFPGVLSYRTIGIQTGRGCPNRCMYCTYPHLEGTVRRSRSAEIVAGEIAMIHRDLGTRDFFMVDSLLNADENHMVKVLECIAALKLPIRFSCYLQPKCSDPGIFTLLKKAGCVAVDFGTDSGSAAMMASLRKSFTKDDIRKVSRACHKAGIDFCHSLLFGGPGENADTIHETIGLMDEVSPRAVIAMTGIRIYPGTEMERISLHEGVIPAGESLLEPRFYFSHMGASALVRGVSEAVENRRNWFFPGKRDWSMAMGFRILRVLFRKGPLWRTFRK